MEKEKIDFWGSDKYFYNDFEFDEEKSLDDLSKIIFTDEKKINFIGDCFNYFLTAENPQNYLLQFSKSMSFIENLFDLEKKQLYIYLLETINVFKKKEDFIFFEVFKEIKEFNEGYNNFILELINWLSYNEEKINSLIKDENISIDIFSSKGWQITKHSQVVGKTGVGKSIFVKQQILKKDVIIISNKDCNLLSFKDVDKDFFYNLLIGLTKEKNLNNFFLSLLKQANNQKIKGIAVYIKKKFHNDFFFF